MTNRLPPAFVSHRHPLVALYRVERETLYTPLAASMARMIGEVLKATDNRVHAVTSRAKMVGSLREKLRQKGDKYKTLDEITDLVGVRVITYLAHDVDRVCHALRSVLTVDESNSVDRRHAQRVEEFGYGSVHLVVSLPDHRTQLPEYRGFAGVRFEIQVRTILQHAWAEIEHDVIYKASASADIESRRSLHRVAALLEQADATFAATITGIVARANDYEAGSSDQSLNEEILTEMCERDAQVLALEHLLDEVSEVGIEHGTPYAMGLRVVSLRRHNIDTPGKLRQAISLHLNRFRLFLPAALKPWNGGESEQWTRGASLSLFCEYLAAADMDPTVARAYLSGQAGYDDEYATERADELVAIVKSIRSLA